MLIKDLLLDDSIECTVEDNRAVFIDKFNNSNGKKVLYIHIPFCPSKCHYCICETRVCNDQNVLEEFVYKTIPEQIKSYFSVLKSTSFDQLYIGGGTPTILNSKMLGDLLDQINNVVDLSKISIKSIECSPSTIEFEHINIFKKYGFDFVSMGVQTLQQNISKWQNRQYVSNDELLVISKVFRESGIYFNYDMICYLGKGDIRDIPMFKEDLTYIMKYCKPSSICVHQHHQIEFSVEKTTELHNVLNKLISSDDLDYECVNALLTKDEILMDTMYQAQYRLVREKREFCHYMWKRYPMVPVKGYDVLGLGFDKDTNVKSNASNLVFSESKNQMSKIVFPKFMYDDFEKVRKSKNLPI